MVNNKYNRKKRTKTFLETLSLFKSKKVIISILVTLGILVLFRIGSIIPMPFIEISSSSNYDSNSFLQMMNLIGGGGLSKVSIFAIAVSPYITAQIIVQLLSTDLIPPLSRLAKSGERGRKKIEVVTRLLTLPFAGIQAYAILSMATSSENSFITFSQNSPLVQGSSLYYFFYISLMIAGTYIAIFLGDLITKRGVGNGITLIILAGIVSSLFSSFQTVYLNLQNITVQNARLISTISFIAYLCFYIFILLAVIFINNSVRKVPIQQVGGSFGQGNDDLSYLPIKINPSGVIPVIFASSLMTIPSTIAQFLPANSSASTWINNYISLESISGIIIYFVLIILFSFFYSYVQMNPQKMSEDFKKSSRFIPGVKVGSDTEKYISRILFRINWIGGPFLAIIATLPYIFSLTCNYASNGAVVIPSYAILGGTGIVIMVSATIDLWQSIKSTATTVHYSYQKKEIENTINSDNSNKENKFW